MWMMLGALACVACSHSGNSSPEAAKSAAAASQIRSVVDEADPCSLLEPREVETVLGAALATPPFLSRDGRPAHDGSACEYEDAKLHNIAIDVEWEHGAMMFGMLGALQGMVDQNAKGLVHLADGTNLAGEWDEAHVVGCCRFSALRGDQVVTVDFGGSNATIAGAARLADAALRRLDKPLPVNGLRNVKPAIEFETVHRPQRRDPCALATRAEAEALVGALSGDPQSTEDRCVYERASAGTSGQVYVLKVRWIGGFGEFRQQNATFGSFSQGLSRNLGLSGDAKEALESAGAGADLPPDPAWEVAHYSVAGLSAVKKDVLISIEAQGGTADDALKLMGKAMSKL
jgi:hypothetical protein